MKNFRQHKNIYRTYLALRERIKELTCLYGISQVAAEINELTIDEIIYKILLLLPPAWQYPEITFAKIVLDNKIHVIADFKVVKNKQVADIIIKRINRGTIEIYYGKNKPTLDEGPFLKEERRLIDTIAKELALIIERKESEVEKIKLRNQLQHADRLATIGELSAGVAHELNEPLASILGYAQLIKNDQSLSIQTRSDLDKIINSSLHAREVVKKLMYFSRQMPLEKKRINLNKIIEEGLSYLESRCAKEEILLERDIAAIYPYIIADAIQINQILINLVVNAIQAMPAGGTLYVRTISSDRYVSLIVEDIGIGMSEEVQKQLFKPFFSTKDIGEGTGLGLSVVYGIIEAHNGLIEVNSTIGKGTIFEVKLPKAINKLMQI